MTEGVKTFEKVYIEIDKMAGLRISLRDNQNVPAVLDIRGWDQKDTPIVKGALLDEQSLPIWEGILLTAQQIDKIFTPFEVETPITYARRSGKLGHPKTVGVIRVETKNAINFTLALCDGGEKTIDTFTTVNRPTRLTLEIEITGKFLREVMLDMDNEKHRKKIKKLLEQ